ncbi:hypothetical protein [Helicobacter heilmannii]|uniref:hypothetical protein n=1 Tax=Helicobacter heilmannii TaxID=35817 RepID=UPI000CF0BBE1|nr:hypothetical protein [Helicobacter heilmannii]
MPRVALVLLMSLCVLIAQEKGARELKMADEALLHDEYQKGFTYLKKAANLGNAEAYGALGYLYSWATGTQL